MPRTKYHSPKKKTPYTDNDALDPTHNALAGIDDQEDEDTPAPLPIAALAGSAGYDEFDQLPVPLSGRDYREQLFIREFLKDLNMREAARRAGYTTSSARDMGLRLYRKHGTQIQRLMEDRLVRLELDADAIVNEVVRMAHCSVQDLYDDNGNIIPIQDLPRHVAACIQSMDVREDRETGGIYDIRKIRLYDKLSALKLMLQHLGLISPDGATQINVQVNNAVDIDTTTLTDEQLDAVLLLANGHDPLPPTDDTVRAPRRR